MIPILENTVIRHVTTIITQNVRNVTGQNVHKVLTM